MTPNNNLATPRGSGHSGSYGSCANPVLSLDHPHDIILGLEAFGAGSPRRAEPPSWVRARLLMPCEGDCHQRFQHINVIITHLKAPEKYFLQTDTSTSKGWNIDNMAPPAAGPPDIIFSGDLPKATISRMLRDGRISKIAKGIYTPDTTSPAQVVARRNWSAIVGRLYPDAVLSGKTAFKRIPEPDGSVYIGIQHKPRSVPTVPGLLIVPRKDAPPTDSDTRVGHLYVPSVGRAVLDNLTASHKTSTRGRRNLSKTELWNWVRVLSQHDQDRMEEKILGQAQRALSSADIAADPKEMRALVSSAAHAIQPSPNKGYPYDPDTVTRVETLARYMTANAGYTAARLGDTYADGPLRSFYEAYFTNYIEGVRMPAASAWQAISSNTADDNLDTQLVLRTLDMAGEHWGADAPDDMDSFIQAMVSRHMVLMEGHNDIGPGTFKRAVNKAGASVFVDPSQVVGTLKEAWGVLDPISDPFTRGALAHFITVDVHPFLDGNGRTSRLMMNGYLQAGGIDRIIVPSVLREQYIKALRDMHDHSIPGPLVDVLIRAHQWANGISWASYELADSQIAPTGAYNDYGQLLIPDLQAQELDELALVGRSAQALPVSTCGKLVARTGRPCRLRTNHDGRCRSVLRHQI